MLRGGLRNLPYYYPSLGNLQGNRVFFPIFRERESVFPDLFLSDLPFSNLFLSDYFPKFLLLSHPLLHCSLRLSLPTKKLGQIGSKQSLFHRLGKNQIAQGHEGPFTTTRRAAWSRTGVTPVRHISCCGWICKPIGEEIREKKMLPNMGARVKREKKSGEVVECRGGGDGMGLVWRRRRRWPGSIVWEGVCLVRN